MLRNATNIRAEKRTRKKDFRPGVVTGPVQTVHAPLRGLSVVAQRLGFQDILSAAASIHYPKRLLFAT